MPLDVKKNEGEGEEAEEGEDTTNLKALERSTNSALLNWCRQRTEGYEGVDITNFQDRYLVQSTRFKALNTY